MDGQNAISQDVQDLTFVGLELSSDFFLVTLGFFGVGVESERLLLLFGLDGVEFVSELLFDESQFLLGLELSILDLGVFLVSGVLYDLEGKAFTLQKGLCRFVIHL